jgi:sugar O-acyltransferase (sialic acid O-acetyltransferase NeuD family)
MGCPNRLAGLTRRGWSVGMGKPIRVVILGTGGTSVDILDMLDDLRDAAAAPRYECIGFLDDDGSRRDLRIHGRPVLGPLALAARLQGCVFVNGIGAPTNFWLKPGIIGRTGVPADRFTTLVHPSTSISRTARLGPGSVVLQHAVVASDVTIGSHVVILPNAVISHESRVGDYTCVAGGVCVSGRVSVGQNCYLGSNSTIIGDVEIGERSLVGMGSVVLQSVQPGSVVAGNPARFLRRIPREDELPARAGAAMASRRP